MNEKSDCLSLDSVALREIAVALGYAKGATFEVMILAIAHLKRERADALAACAEMRAALEAAYAIHQRCECAAPPCTCTGFEAARDALSRPDLGAGMAVPREVVERLKAEVAEAREERDYYERRADDLNQQLGGMK